MDAQIHLQHLWVYEGVSDVNVIIRGCIRDSVRKNDVASPHA